MHVIRTDGNFLKYNNVAMQFVMVWLGIVAIMVDVKHYSQSMEKNISISSNNMHGELGKKA